MCVLLKIPQLIAWHSTFGIWYHILCLCVYFHFSNISWDIGKWQTPGVDIHVYLIFVHFSSICFLSTFVFAFFQFDCVFSSVCILCNGLRLRRERWRREHRGSMTRLNSCKQQLLYKCTYTNKCRHCQSGEKCSASLFLYSSKNFIFHKQCTWKWSQFLSRLKRALKFLAIFWILFR